jgi:hypothetical protein
MYHDFFDFFVCISKVISIGWLSGNKTKRFVDCMHKFFAADLELCLSAPYIFYGKNITTIQTKIISEKVT